MLEIKDLEVSSDGKKILKGVNVRIGPGETCVLLGPNGSGKSTLLHAIVGNPKFRVDGGAIYFKGKDILGMPTNERIKLGLGISFQYPPAVRGVKLSDLLEEITGAERVEEIADKMGLRDFLRRDLNLGFSGGELKRSEIAQLLALEPSLILLDEPDSGVDIENLELIGEVINELLQRESRPRYRERSGLIITHMGSIMQYVKADRGFVMVDGKIACCGNPEELISQIKKNGYGECMKCVD